MFALVLTGPPGVGKSAVLEALTDVLCAEDMRHATVEVEALTLLLIRPAAAVRSRGEWPIPRDIAVGGACSRCLQPRVIAPPRAPVKATHSLR